MNPIKSKHNYCDTCGREKSQWSKGKNCLKCMVINKSTIFKDMEIDDAFGYWLAGFTDGEGNFQFLDARPSGVKRSDAMYRIVLREDDKPVLEMIRYKLGCGKLFYRDVSNKRNWKPEYQSKNMQNQWVFKVGNTHDLVTRIIPFFEKYLLKSKKRSEFEKWSDQVREKWFRIRRKGIKEVV